MTTVLVTGAYGFIGRHVAREAASRGHRVAGIGHGSWTRQEQSDWGLKSWREATVSLDALRDLDSLPDVIIHCAGGSDVGHSMTRPWNDFKRTVDSTADLLEFIRADAPDCRLVLTSSAAVYGDAADLPIRIDSTLKPISPYGVHKKLAEDVCREYAEHFGVTASIVRLFSVYGVGLRKQLLWDACGKWKRGEFAFGGTGEEVRDWIHVDDAARLIVSSADCASTSAPLVNGASGVGLKIRTVVEALAQVLPKCPPPEFTGVARSGNPSRFIADITQAAELGWRPERSFSDGVAEYAQWFQGLDL
ncbi:NAD-dependent epimerase/dehydratase family protein [Nocardioides sp. Kera G14]|uniref:NAD-dependent epimerase/dehydratase family protein n=1 Tax=Nocardioides sp. Kera G14 TaxID=2884264 RepID=UPI001D123848|nr:NAD(P)-dependent oxidoreductase [Nocardioides sp. Kera G14]UDY23116.1 NAD(P)-dependent oxidoreductase [Nocardioides sp. Kera G14]